MMKKNLTLFISLLFFSLPLFAVGFSVSPFAKQDYENKKLGIRLEIPGNWTLEETERFYSLVLKPRSVFSRQDAISIVIWENATAEKDLVAALEDDLERIKSVSKLEKIVYLDPPQRYSRNNYEAAIVTIEMPIEHSSEARNPVTQPMDIIAINSGERLIFVFVRKSNSAAFLNQQANTIVQSIELLQSGK